MLRVPPPTARRMSALTGLLTRGYALAGTPIPAQRLHVTLLSLGHHVDVPPALVERARLAAATVAMPAFEVTFNRIEAWSGSQALALLGDDTAAQVAVLRHALAAALQRAGVPYANALFNPHVSLMRGLALAEAQTVETFSWTVQDFALVNSLTGHGRYVQLGQWPLPA
ncbi:2'-5' RNA ligase family protein [Vineibacter terrae]|nr:2'-5' RNA ligase family protein [Vineibacter terrae]